MAPQDVPSLSLYFPCPNTKISHFSKGALVPFIDKYYSEVSWLQDPRNRLSQSIYTQRYKHLSITMSIFTFICKYVLFLYLSITMFKTAGAY